MSLRPPDLATTVVAGFLLAISLSIMAGMTAVFEFLVMPFRIMIETGIAVVNVLLVTPLEMESAGVESTPAGDSGWWYLVETVVVLGVLLVFTRTLMFLGEPPASRILFAEEAHWEGTSRPEPEKPPGVLSKQYPINTFDRNVKFHESYQTRHTTTECINCGVETDGGYAIRFGRMDVVAGVIVNKDVEGRHYECAPCHEDPIEAALRASREDPEEPEVDGEELIDLVLVTCRMCDTINTGDRTHCGECDHPLPMAPTPGGDDG